MVFGKYADYYDALYAEKQYLVEVNFLQSLLAEHGGFETVLDLGCGTGGHSIPLAQTGVAVTGVDRSAQMLEGARRKAESELAQIELIQGDIREIRLHRTFDAVIALYSVVGYQTGNGDLLSVFKTARAHLQKDHCFVFDAWFGPAVLAQRPEDRVRELKIGDERIIRFARPELNILKDTVTVHYMVLKSQGDRLIDETCETHQIRYFFEPEMEFFAEQVGFEIVKACPFLEPDCDPTEQDWNVIWVLKAI